MTKGQRVLFTVLLVGVIGGSSAYQAIHRVRQAPVNQLDRQMQVDFQYHPVASILGSMFPAIILSPLAYWISGIPNRKKQKK